MNSIKAKLEPKCIVFLLKNNPKHPPRSQMKLRYEISILNKILQNT